MSCRGRFVAIKALWNKLSGYMEQVALVLPNEAAFPKDHHYGRHEKHHGNHGRRPTPPHLDISNTQDQRQQIPELPLYLKEHPHWRHHIERFNDTLNRNDEFNDLTQKNQKFQQQHELLEQKIQDLEKIKQELKDYKTKQKSVEFKLEMLQKLVDFKNLSIGKTFMDFIKEIKSEIANNSFFSSFSENDIQSFIQKVKNEQHIQKMTLFVQKNTIENVNQAVKNLPDIISQVQNLVQDFSEGKSLLSTQDVTKKMAEYFGKLDVAEKALTADNLNIIQKNQDKLVQSKTTQFQAIQHLKIYEDGLNEQETGKLHNLKQAMKEAKNEPAANDSTIMNLLESLRALLPANK